MARGAGVPVLPRGGGTSQCGQTVNRPVVIDLSKHLNRLVAVDREARSCVVEPGLVLDRLNAAPKPTGPWFPVDVSTPPRPTPGGMAAHNCSGPRPLPHDPMRHTVAARPAPPNATAHRRES